MTDQSDRAAFLAAHDVSRETLGRLDRVIATLDDWRMRSNLIGPKEWPQIWTRHVGDSVQLLDRIPDTAKVVDLGSGAGFPGLVIAAARPAGHVTLMESVGKKCAFLRAAIEAQQWQRAAEILDVVGESNVDADHFKLLGQYYASAKMYDRAENFFIKGNFKTEAIKMYITAGLAFHLLFIGKIINRLG